MCYSLCSCWPLYLGDPVSLSARWTLSSLKAQLSILGLPRSTFPVCFLPFFLNQIFVSQTIASILVHFIHVIMASDYSFYGMYCIKCFTGLMISVHHTNFIKANTIIMAIHCTDEKIKLTCWSDMLVKCYDQDATEMWLRGCPNSSACSFSSSMAASLTASPDFSASLLSPHVFYPRGMILHFFPMHKDIYEEKEE